MPTSPFLSMPEAREEKQGSAYPISMNESTCWEFRDPHCGQPLLSMACSQAWPEERAGHHGAVSLSYLPGHKAISRRAWPFPQFPFMLAFSYSFTRPRSCARAGTRDHIGFPCVFSLPCPVPGPDSPKNGLIHPSTHSTGAGPSPRGCTESGAPLPLAFRELRVYMGRLGGSAAVICRTG